MDRTRWLPIACIAVLSWLALYPILTVDVYYHLAIGQHILDSGEIPSRGIGSATFGEAPWHDNEWGFQVLAALVGRAAEDADGVRVLTPLGRALLILLRAACLAGTLALNSSLLARRGLGPIPRAVAVVWIAFLTFGNLFWAVRPQILSYLALAALVWLIDDVRFGRRRAVVLGLALIAVWANVHGAFIIGIALLGAEAAAAWLARQVPAARRLTLMTLLAPLAACLNPYGYHQVLHPFLYLARPEIYRGNLEWTRPDWLHLPLLVLTLLLFAMTSIRLPRPRLRAWCVVLPFLVLFSGAIRHLPLIAIVVVPWTVQALQAAADGPGFLRHLWPVGPAAAPRSRRLIGALIASVVIVSLSGAKFIRPWPSFEEGMLRPMPENAVRFAARHGLDGTALNAYRFGGFLIYRLYPEEPVFMDGRNDLYGTFRDRVYNPLLQAEAGWRGAWREQQVDWVLLDASTPLLDRLEQDPEWVGAREDRAAITDGEGPDAVALLVRRSLLDGEARREIEGFTPRERP